ncbi:RelA/SpoT domain-containing protein [Micromonospora sp. NPDC005298]|uniref:GTP pyrophosphokinase n=1 Tax=Micromonospora sp. NPDC005298 TaxID=3156873 RepID=UPI0033ACE9DB
MDLISQFIARYTKEYDFYDQAGRLAARELEATLQAAGIRSLVTYRAKSIARLRDKCLKREQQNPYTTVDEIFDDIVDLVGIRVALYFPAEHKQVDGIVNRLFAVFKMKHFPDDAEPRKDKRFSGYAATHYRVQLKEQDLGDTEKRYAIAKIEIQVASVLMHAWSEVEHDLVYKPLAGELSEDELAILDQLNGLVLAGEIALERLQKAGERRVAHSGRTFVNHYDLAVHLLSRVPSRLDQPVNEEGLGRVDLLFDLITRLQLDTPDKLLPYLEALDDDLERRPLAQQVIDAMLAEDPSRYELFARLRERRQGTLLNSIAGWEDTATHMGAFLMYWVEFEKLLRSSGVMRGRSKYMLPRGHDLLEAGLLPPKMAMEYDRIRQLRNRLVHGLEPPSKMDVTDSVQRLKEVAAEILRRLKRRSNSDADYREEE